MMRTGGEDVDEVRGDKRCCNCGTMGHFERDCRMRGKGKGKGRDGGKGYTKGRGKLAKGAGKKGSGKSGGFKNRKAGDIKDSAGSVARF